MSVEWKTAVAFPDTIPLDLELWLLGIHHARSAAASGAPSSGPTPAPTESGAFECTDCLEFLVAADAGKSAGLLSVMSADMAEVRELTTAHWKDQEKAKNMLATLATAAASFQAQKAKQLEQEAKVSYHAKVNI